VDPPADQSPDLPPDTFPRYKDPAAIQNFPTIALGDGVIFAAMRRHPYPLVLLLLLVGTSAACVTGIAIPTGPRPYAATPDSQSIDTYVQGQPPGRPFDQVGIVEARFRGGTGMISPAIARLLPTLHAKARELGADAVLITNISDHPFGGLHPAYLTNPILEIVAVAIRYAPLPSSEVRREAVEEGRVVVAAATGFAISNAGHILTNAHVVRGCSDIRVTSPSGDMGPTSIIAIDSVNDLALLRVSPAPRDIAVFRGGRGLRQGDTILAVGFPLRSVLASQTKLSTGTVTALAGPHDDARYLQISAPIQPGNSGGPLLDTSGNVVGVIVSTLDAVRVVQLTGDIPQNVNFAIHGEVARLFLDSKGVEYDAAASTVTHETADIADQARKFVFVVECSK
jgi:S1-C subfamily serine protease